MRGSKDFASGGWGEGVQAQLPENGSDKIFLVLNFIYSFTEGVQWFFQRKLLFSKVSEGVQLFLRGGGVQMLISIETHITCDFWGGSPDPLSPSGSAHVALFNAQMFWVW